MAATAEPRTRGARMMRSVRGRPQAETGVRRRKRSEPPTPNRGVAKRQGGRSSRWIHHGGGLQTIRTRSTGPGARRTWGSRALCNAGKRGCLVLGARDRIRCRGCFGRFHIARPTPSIPPPSTSAQVRPLRSHGIHGTPKIPILRRGIGSKQHLPLTRGGCSGPGRPPRAHALGHPDERHPLDAPPRSR